jgi:hypothetical protein
MAPPPMGQGPISEREAFDEFGTASGCAQQIRD